MDIQPTALPEVLMITPKVYFDQRGFFMETYQQEKYYVKGIPNAFVQDNQSGSYRGTLRGLHYQIRQPQGKLIRCIVGEIYDVTVDIRRSSPNFGKWFGITLSAQNKTQLWIPAGFAHGIYVTSDWAEILYKTTDYYAPEWERTLLWNDPKLKIDWPLLDNGACLMISPKDADGKTLQEAETYA
jgi:dTDP-4-dehydrorhamnose 3,5-epimerase